MYYYIPSIFVVVVNAHASYPQLPVPTSSDLHGHESRMTELLTVHNQECWRNIKPILRLKWAAMLSINALDQNNANGFLHSLQP